jgi:chemotaxis protein MotB
VSKLATGVAVVAAICAVVAGGAQWRTRVATQARADAQQSAAEKLQKDLDACGAARAKMEKEASDTASTLTSSRAELEGLRNEHADAEKQLASFKALTEKFQKMIDSGKLQIMLRHGRMVVKLQASVLFASGSAELSKDGKDALHEVAGILRKVHDRSFMVAGHTDSMPIDPKANPPSPFKNNLELSTARALTVAQHLITSGMNPAHIVAAGYGEHEPVQSNAHEAGRQENRRIEIVLLPNVTEVAAGSGGSGADAGAPATGDAGFAGR